MLVLLKEWEGLAQANNYMSVAGPFDDDVWLEPTDMHAIRRCLAKACHLSFMGLPRSIQHSTIALHEIIHIHLLDLKR
jgi:hypothetical protein